VTFLKSFFAGIIVLAVALLARSILVRALQLNAGSGAGSPPAPDRPGQALPARSGPRAAARSDPRPPARPKDEPEDLLDAMINVRRIEGRINAASTRRLAELLQRHPDLAAQAMRRWLAQGNDSR
jgi:flagellar M-ring protein FliF